MLDPMTKRVFAAVVLLLMDLGIFVTACFRLGSQRVGLAWGILAAAVVLSAGALFWLERMGAFGRHKPAPAAKRSLPYETVAVVLMLLGAGFLVEIYEPFLNPGSFHAQTGRTGMPLAYYVILTPVAVLILLAALLFNRKAQRLRSRKQRQNKNEEQR